MKTMYFVRGYSDSIYELTVGKETDKCVWFTSMRNIEKSTERETHCAPGSRILKSSAYHEVLPTVEEAIQFIRRRYARRIEGAEATPNHYREQSAAFEKAVVVLLGEVPIEAK